MIGDKLKEYRLLNNLTQSRLSIYLGISRDMYCKIETNKNQLSIDKLLKLCKLYRCSPNQLLKGNY